MELHTKFNDDNVAISGSAGFNAALDDRKRRERSISNGSDLSSPPFELKSLMRSPSAILEKKNASIIRERSSPDYEESPIAADLSRARPPPPTSLASVTARNNNYDEELIAMRLFYLGIIKDLKSSPEAKENEGGDEKNGAESKAVEELVKVQKSLEGKLEESQKRCSLLQNELNAVEQDLMIMKQAKSITDKKHIDDLNLFQKQMDIFSQGRSSIFSVPPPSIDMMRGAENSEKNLISLLSSNSRLVEFSELVSISIKGQLLELSQGDHGSNFIKERIKYGLIGSNHLVKRGLGLPKSLLSILLTGNLFIRDVVLTLVDHDETARDEVEVEVARLRSAIEMVEDGKSFLFQMDKITNRMRF